MVLGKKTTQVMASDTQLVQRGFLLGLFIVVITIPVILSSY